MAKFLCKCGVQVRTSGAIPNPDEWHLIADGDFDVESTGQSMMGRSIYAWRCASCGRLWVDDGRVGDARSDTLWEFVPAFPGEGPLAPK